jgi:large subunit ribosomal protein L31
MLKLAPCCLMIVSGGGIRDEFTFIESRMMRDSIHPAYEVVQVTCSCGQVFETRSTLCHSLNIEVCAECHPFYTGQQKLVDTGGRVQKFRDRYKSRIETQKETK